MRLVFIHGIHQEDKAPAALQGMWEDALLSAWARAGLAKPDYALEMPYYGALLAESILKMHGGFRTKMTSGAEAQGPLRRLEQALIRDIGVKKGINESHICAELERDFLRSELAHWEWVLGIARSLDRDVPELGSLALHFARQVDAYLTCPEIRDAVDNVIRPAFLRGPTVIVAHSLGSDITYRLLRELEDGAEVPLLVTVGSPLGIGVVKTHLSPPLLKVPAGVRSWLNATDERDCVALYACLDGSTFTDGVENVADVHHGKDINPHAITDYVGHASVAGRIHAALSGAQSLN
jgi:hypothetical protein